MQVIYILKIVHVNIYKLQQFLTGHSTWRCCICTFTLKYDTCKPWSHIHWLLFASDFLPKLLATRVGIVPDVLKLSDLALRSYWDRNAFSAEHNVSATQYIWFWDACEMCSLKGLDHSTSWYGWHSARFWRLRHRSQRLDAKFPLKLLPEGVV